MQIIDPGVAYANYSVFNDGLASGVYVNRSSGSAQPRLQLCCGQGGRVFPDFTSEKGRDWWHKQLAQYMARLPLDGCVDLDMNEAWLVLRRLLPCGPSGQAVAC